jgi:hypothetical protein
MTEKPSGVSGYEWGPLTAVAKATGHLPLTRKAMKEYSSFTDRLTKHHGKRTCVKVLKDLFSRTKLSAVGVKIESCTYGGIWLKPNKTTGLPSTLPSLSLLLVRDEWGKRLACSITSQVEAMRLPPSTDIRSITDPSTARRESLDTWSRLVEDYSSKVWKKVFSIADREDRYHTSTSAGPNGGASLISSIYDAKYFVTSDIWEQYQYWCDVLDRGDLKKMIVNCHNSLTELRAKYKHLNKIASRKEPLKPAKLIYLADKAGKTRVVYCLSWWVQELLHPLHRGLYRLLYTIKQDGTKSHSEAASIVKQWTAEGKKLWSIDLTSATDRFPKELQISVIKGLLGDNVSKVWSQIMAIKPWSEPHKQYISYSVGQPMGAKTSWAIFALTHHTVLRIITDSHGLFEKPYVIIGDDIVISNEKVALDYIKFLEDLGIPYSKDKTIFPKENGPSNAEFAKRIFCNGLELSPLTVSLVDRVYKHRDYPVFLSIIKEIESKWGPSHYVTREFLHLLPPTTVLFEMLPNIWRKVVVVSLCKDTPMGSFKENPYKDNPKGVIPGGRKTENPWASADRLTYYFALGEVMTKRVQVYVDMLTKINVYFTGLQDLPEKVSVGKVLLHVEDNPFRKVVNRTEEVTKRVYRAISEGDVNLQMIMDLGLDLSYMVSLITTGRSWESHKRLLERRDKQTISFWKEVMFVYDKLANPPEWDDEGDW